MNELMKLKEEMREENFRGIVPEDFIIRIVKLSETERVTTISRELKIPVTTLYKWKNEFGQKNKKQKEKLKSIESIHEEKKISEKEWKNDEIDSCETWNEQKEIEFVKLRDQRELSRKNSTNELNELLIELMGNGEVKDRSEVLSMLIAHAHRFEKALKPILLFRFTL